MLSLRSRSVNVNRLDLIEAIKRGKDLHLQAYAEAQSDYQINVSVFLTEAVRRVSLGDFTQVKIPFDPPVLRSAEYDEVIEMMEVSVDETINLDAESYKAYYKNEWPWTRSFLESAQMYKSMLGAAAGAAS